MIMLSLKAKHFPRARVIDFISKSHISAVFNTVTSSFATSTCQLPIRDTAFQRNNGEMNDQSKDFIVSSFKDRCASRDEGVFREIFTILGTSIDAKLTDLALTKLGLKLDEAFVLKVFRFGNCKDIHILSCLRFFEWAGQQTMFCHTRVTFDAIFRVLSRTKILASMLDFHDRDAWCSGGAREARFHRALVVGYAVTGKPEFSLQLLGKMRYRGMDLDRFGYNVLLLSLVEHGRFEAVKSIGEQIEIRGFENEATFAAMVESLCKQKRFDEAEDYLRNKVSVARENTLRVLVNSNKGDIAARILIKMQESGYEPNRDLSFSVIRCLCQMENTEKQFLELLDSHLAHQKSNCHQIYNLFIDIAGHAQKPDLSREVYKAMLRNGTKPTLQSDILMLQTYFKSERVSDAVKFFETLREKREFGRKLCHVMLAGFCKADMADTALSFFKEMKANGLLPTIQCYELLIKLLCSNGKYDTVVNIVKEYEKTGRLFTSFIGNTLLLNSFKSDEVYDAWNRPSKNDSDDKSKGSMLGQLIGVFCGRVELTEERLEEQTERCFPLDLFTYNILLRRLCSEDTDRALELFDRMCEKGFKPNLGTYETLVHGFLRHGKREEAKRWYEEMIRKGFRPSESIAKLV